MYSVVSASIPGRADAAAGDPGFVLAVVLQVVQGAARAWPGIEISSLSFSKSGTHPLGDLNIVKFFMLILRVNF